MKEENELSQSLTFFTTLTIVVGAVIGSGIFKKPAVMADQLGSPELLIGVWIVAGLLTLFGALTNAEIASMITATGGQYVFFEKMYGRLFAFLYGWGLFGIIQTGSIASITWVFAEYSQYFHAFFIPDLFSKDTIDETYFFIPFIGKIYLLKYFGIKLITCGAIILLSAANYFGVIFGGRIANIFTIAKVLAIFVLVYFAFSWGGSIDHLTTNAEVYSFKGAGIFAGIIAALSGAFWSYDGWNNITYIAGEVKKPQETIPKSLIFGTLIIISVYLLINFAYLYVLDIETMAKSTIVAADVALLTMGQLGAAFVSAAVMISTFGTSNGTIMVSARVYYAMSRNGMFFQSIGKSHSRWKTPANSLIWQAIWSCLLVFTGTFDTLTDMLIFCIMDILCSGGLWSIYFTEENARCSTSLQGYWLSLCSSDIYIFCKFICNFHSL